MATLQNTYNEGMNLDVSPFKIKNTQYKKALNFKRVDNNGNTGSLINEKGNKLDFRIPNLPATYIINYNDVAPVFQLVINGDALFQTGIGSSAEELKNILESYPLFQAQIENGDFQIFVQDDNLLFVGLNELTMFGVTGFPVQIQVPALENLQIIHLQNFNDDIIVFTTSNTDENSINADGQIWHLKYNEVTNTVENLTGEFLTPNAHLKYNNLANFSTEHAITKSVVRYETKNICRVYWTDFFNSVRSFNLFNPNGLSLKPADLDITADIKFTKPTVTSIDSGGNIPSGSSVQIGYRLIGNNKASNLSPLSNPISIYTVDSKTTNYGDIKGSNQSEGIDNKSLTLNITNLDTSYNFVEVIYIIYEFKDVPLVYSTIEVIPPDGNLTKIFTNNESTLITLSEEEINMLVSELYLAKDIEVKDNRLLAANLKFRNFDISDEIFDARTYRFNPIGEAIVYDKSGNIFNVPNTLTVPEEHDAISPNTLLESDPLFIENYKYQSDGTTLGGEGKQIKYSFITKNIIGDELGTRLSTPWSGVTNKTNTEENFSNIIEHSIINQYNNYTSPFIQYLYTGYQQDEVYRFGIVFRSTKGEISPVKWIGDIKFPTSKEGSDYRLTNGGNGSATNPNFLKVKGIKFEITIPEELKDVISSYEIVRVERKSNDKRRICGGAIQPVQLDDTTVKVREGSATLNHAYDTFTNTVSVSNGSLVTPREYVGYISPETLFSEASLSHKENDYLKLFSAFGVINHFEAQTPPLAPQVSITKAYGHFNIPFVCDEILPINNFSIVERGNGQSLDSIDGATTLNNFRNITGGTDSSYADVACNKTCIMALDSNESIIQDGSDALRRVYYALYCRDVIDQYGGNSFEERSFNQYISVGAFIPSNETSVIDVFGGDTFLNYFPYEYVSDAFAATLDEKISSLLAFPCESSINTDVRSGLYFNKDRNISDFSNEVTDPFNAYGAEQFVYNKVYSQENNTTKLYNAKNFLLNTVDELPFTVWSSQVKQNGELIDSWSQFLAADKIDVDGIYGPINSIHNFKNKLFFYQNSAFGAIAINERVTVPDENGTSIIIGDGQVLGDYAYVSTHTGCFHRTGVILSENNAYHFDVRQKKLWRYSLDSKLPLSDVKGMFGFLTETFKQTPIESIDNPTSNDIPFNVHGAYDHKYNRVFITLRSAEDVIQGEEDRPPLINSTFSYNELFDSFDSFYSFTPKLYLSTGRKLLSVNPTNSNSVYQHDEGEYGIFYDGSSVPSTIEYIINNGSHISKIFNNLEWVSNVTDNNNNDIYNETFDFIRVSNDYQDTQLYPLQIPELIKRRFRVWRHSIQRDVNPDGIAARIRNPWALIELRYNNSNNNKFVMHDLITHYNQQPINNYQK